MDGVAGVDVPEGGVRREERAGRLVGAEGEGH